MREAEERASHLQDTSYQFEHHQEQVQIPNPNPKILYNAKGNPYVEGDPNLGYRLEDTRPQTTSCATGSSSLQPDSDPTPSSPSHKPAANQPHSQPHTHQPNPKSGVGQSQPKPKPKNWASLLQSQSPSMDMKLDYFPDLQRGKEA